MATRKVHLRDSHEALLLFGQHDQNLRALEQTYNVQIFGRGHTLSIRGTPAKVEKAILAIEEMRENLGRENRGAVIEPLKAEVSGDVTYTSAMGKSIRPKTPMQKTYAQAIIEIRYGDRHRPGGHGENLSGGGLRAGVAESRGRFENRADAAGG